MEKADEVSQEEVLEENGNQQEESISGQITQVKASVEIPGKIVSIDNSQKLGLDVEESLQCLVQPEKKVGSSSYITSTPKKEVQFLESINKFELFPSQMILDDPLLSSIDDPGGDLTDQELNSLTYDDEEEESEEASSARLCETKIRSDLSSASASCTLISRFMSDGSTRQKVSHENSVSSVCKDVRQTDLSSARRNLFDIPVSPKLKSRVRQRLFNLVNSIDGYKGRVDLESDDKISRCETFSALENRSESSKPSYALNRRHQKLQEQSGRLGSERLAENCLCNEKRHSEKMNISCASSFSNDMTERYSSAISSILESQLRTLHLHQEQLSQEKLNLTLQKKEEEADARITLYKDKLYQILQMVEVMEVKLENSERKRIQEAQHFRDKTNQQNERHKHDLSLLRLEYEKKVQVAESVVASARLEVTKACDERIFDVMKSSRERIAVVEKKHEDQISELNSTISRLQAERRDGKSHINDKVWNDTENRLLADIAQVSRERDSLRTERDSLKLRLASLCEEDKKTAEQQQLISELELKQRTLQEEVDVWREEAKKLQEKFVNVEMYYKTKNQENLEDAQKQEQHKMEMLKSRHNQECVQFNNVIERMKGELSKALAENEKLKHNTRQIEKELQSQHKDQSAIYALEEETMLLRVQLRDTVSSLTREKENFLQLQNKHAKEVAEMKEQNEQEMINYRLLMERERSIAVSRAMLHREEETMALLRGVENRYQELLKTLQAHFKAQIEEYKKAVKILKLKVQRLEEVSAT